MIIPIDESESGMELHDLLLDEQFCLREKRPRDPNRELNAFCRLARIFLSPPEAILQELVDVAVALCGADSAGISLEELGSPGIEPHFRWIAVSGTFAEFINGTTPRFFSPCGTCLSSGRAQFYRVSKPYYDFLGIEAKPITDGILIPWEADEMRGTIWAVSHQSSDAFDMADYELLKGLAEFAAIAVLNYGQQQVAREQERLAAYANMANQLAHELNNPLQALTNLIYLASQPQLDPKGYITQARSQLADVAGLVSRLLSLHGVLEEPQLKLPFAA